MLRVNHLLLTPVSSGSGRSRRIPTLSDFPTELRLRIFTLFLEDLIARYIDITPARIEEEFGEDRWVLGQFAEKRFALARAYLRRIGNLYDYPIPIILRHINKEAKEVFDKYYISIQ